MEYGLIGEKLGHSFSKEIHERLGRYRYELMELAPQELEGFLAARKFRGINVTIPYKQAVMPYLDEISELAREIGAVNTVVNHGDRLVGYNTDFGGMKMLIERLGVCIDGKKVFIAGSGGTSKTAAAVCRALGASETVRASRTGKDGAIQYDEAYRLCSDAVLLINATPAGMFPDVDAKPVDICHFEKLEGVVDVIYNPLSTRLLRDAAARGIRAVNGLYMLVSQAMLAAEFFTDVPVDEKVTERIYDELTAEKRNIVLTGMPGSGKSTLGKILSDKLGMELVEADQEIVKEAGMPITEIFRIYGEQYFRDLESRLIRRVSEKGGQVISTGGGAVLREENVDNLRMNGKIVFLDRQLDQLLPADERPLADSLDKLRRLYSERYPVYTGTADVTVKIKGTEEESAEQILNALQ